MVYVMRQTLALKKKALNLEYHTEKYNPWPTLVNVSSKFITVWAKRCWSNNDLNKNSFLQSSFM